MTLRQPGFFVGIAYNEHEQKNTKNTHSNFVNMCLLFVRTMLP